MARNIAVIISGLYSKNRSNSPHQSNRARTEWSEPITAREWLDDANRDLVFHASREVNDELARCIGIARGSSVDVNAAAHIADLRDTAAYVAVSDHLAAAAALAAVGVPWCDSHDAASQQGAFDRNRLIAFDLSLAGIEIVDDVGATERSAILYGGNVACVERFDIHGGALPYPLMLSALNSINTIKQNIIFSNRSFSVNVSSAYNTED